MNILMLTNKMPYPPRDGGSIATLSIATSFAALGHKVAMLAMNTSKHYCAVNDIPDELKRKVKIIGVDVDTSISVYSAFRNYFASSIPYNAERFITEAYDKQLTEMLTAEKFDVIHLEGPYLGPYIRTIRKHTNALVSMRPQNVEHEIWERTAALASGLKKFYLRSLARRIKRFETSMMNNYDVLVPITSRDAGIYKELGCTIPLYVAPTGIDSSAFKPDSGSTAFPSLFHLGALDWSPNQEGLKWFFSKVWKRIHQEYPELRFFLAGRNAPSYFQHLSEPNVEFLGEVENAHDFIRSKSVMIVPLLSGSGLRIKIIEGMALGKAIITTSIGSEGINCKHKENIMIADDPDAFIEATRYLLADKTRVEEMGRKAADFVRTHYDNMTINSALLDFYNQQLN